MEKNVFMDVFMKRSNESDNGVMYCVMLDCYAEIVSAITVYVSNQAVCQERLRFRNEREFMWKYF